MEGGLLVWIGFGWWAVASTVQWASAALGRKSRTAAAVHHRPSDFSIVAPLNGAADASAAYVAALRALSEQGAEVLICIADGEDGALGAVRAQCGSTLPRRRATVGKGRARPRTQGSGGAREFRGRARARLYRRPPGTLP